jgi:hypothetical protein
MQSFASDDFDATLGEAFRQKRLGDNNIDWWSIVIDVDARNIQEAQRRVLR